MATPSLKEIIEREDSELRQLVHGEIELGRRSKYWIGPAERHLSSENDFDCERLASDMKVKFPHLLHDTIMSGINSKIYWLHLR